MSDALVSTGWLADRLDAPDIRIVDATWFLPGGARDAEAEFRRRHIPGAVRFDIESIADTASPLPHMVPSAAKFSARVRGLGLGDGSRIVIYDDNGFIASARAWWMFRLFGHAEVAVLDGGLAKWSAEGRPVTDQPTASRERHFTARVNNLLIRELDQVRANMTSRREQVLDVRSAGRFAGREPEPRPGLRAGHIPGSLSLPYSELVGADKTLLPPAELRQRFAAADVDLGRPIVASCGSGVSAAVAALALLEVGRTDVAVYDGSWAEWGSLPDTPVAVR